MFDTVRTMFYNSVGFNTAEIILDTGDREISIYYHLNDNPVQHIWQRLHSDTKLITIGIAHGKSIEYLVSELNLLLIKNNLPTLDFPIIQEQLNKLHNDFVQNENTFIDAQRMNLLIHAIETKNNILTDYDATIKFYKDPNSITFPIKEEYKLWLVNDNKWGYLLLGFGTLGKSWNEIVKTDDTLDDLNIQTTISSETSMIFNAEYPFLKSPERLLYKWSKTSSHDVPLDNLNKLSLGNYLLGEIIITDVFLNYNKNISDWYVPNHKCKLMWNKEILGFNTVVKKINFFNSDMYFNTLLDHSQLGSICIK